MTQKRYLKLEVFSRRALAPSVARDQLLWLADFSNGSFEPERCDVYEPLKESFDRNRLETPVHWLSQPGGEFKFKRTRHVKLKGVLRNRKFGSIMTRQDKKSELQPLLPRVAEPRFVSAWAVWIEYGQRARLDIDLLKSFLLGAFQISGADFAFLTTEEDQKTKNFRVTIEDWGTVEGFVGDDPEKGLPGLYWMNLLGRLYVDWFGADRIGQIRATVRQFRADGSLFLQFGEEPDDAQSESVAEMQTAVKRVLGEDAFFDITHPDRPLSAPSFG